MGDRPDDFLHCLNRTEDVRSPRNESIFGGLKAWRLISSKRRTIAGFRPESSLSFAEVAHFRLSLDLDELSRCRRRLSRTRRHTPCWSRSRPKSCRTASPPCNAFLSVYVFTSVAVRRYESRKTETEDICRPSSDPFLLRVCTPKVVATWPDQSSLFLISLEDYVFSAK